MDAFMTAAEHFSRLFHTASYLSSLPCAILGSYSSALCHLAPILSLEHSHWLPA